MLPPCSTSRPLTACTMPARSGQVRVRTKAGWCGGWSVMAVLALGSTIVASTETHSVIRNTTALRSAYGERRQRGSGIGPVRRPGPHHPGHPRPARRGRRHRDRRRARRAQEHRVPAGRDARVPRHGGAERGARQVPPRRRGAPAGRCDDRPPRRRAGGPADLPQARRGLGGDREHRGALGPVGALPRPGRRPVRAPVAQLGRPAHPAARHVQRQGAAVAGCPPTRSTTGCPGCRRTPRRPSPRRPSCAASSSRCASRGTPSRSTSSRSG